MKYIRLASDLHLEWIREEKDRLDILPEDELDSESCLVLAGDIGNGTRLVRFIEHVAPRFERILYIPGNHEYYNCKNMKDWDRKFSEALVNVPNLLFHPGGIGHYVFPESKVEFVAATLWTDCMGGNPMAKSVVEHSINDFKAIPHFSTARMCEIHRQQKAGIKNYLERANPDHKVIVVTHHTPSIELCHPKWGDTLSNYGFHSDCNDLLSADYKPDAWIFGHTHDKITKSVHGTLCFSNPRGYPNEPSGYDFNDRFFYNIQEGRIL